MKKIYILIGIVAVLFVLFVFLSKNTQTITQAPQQATSSAGATASDTNNTSSTTGNTAVLPIDSGVEGTVTLGPTCPVTQSPPDPGCADKPYSVLIEVVASGTPDGSSFDTAQSGGDGKYQIMLPPGDYTLEPDSGAVLPKCVSKDITVVASQILEADLTCDTGIR